MIIHLIYFVLNILMLWALYKSGCRISRLKLVTFKTMLGASWLGILAFTLNEGLRWGRGLDYNLYANSFYSNSSDYFWEEYEPIYATLSVLLKETQLPFQILIMLASFLLIVSLICFIRNFRKAAPWGLPIFAMMCQEPENLIRWYLGASFLIIGFSFLLKENKKKNDVLVFSIISFMSMFVHFGLVIMPFVVYLMTRLKHPILKPYVSIPSFFVIGIFFQTDFMLLLTEYLNLFSMLNDKADYYITNAEQWLTGGSSILTFRTFPSIPKTFVYIITIWLGYKLTKILKSKQFIIIYNIFLVGFLLTPIGNQIEIGSRYVQLLFMYQYVVGGYILYYLSCYRTMLIRNKAVTQLVVFFLFSYGGLYLSRSFRSPEYTQLYIWNTNGRKYQDLDKTYYKDMFNMQKEGK